MADKIRLTIPEIGSNIIINVGVSDKVQIRQLYEEYNTTYLECEHLKRRLMKQSLI